MALFQLKARKAVFLAVAAIALMAGAHPSEEQAVIRQVDALYQAMASGDAAGVKSIWENSPTISIAGDGNERVIGWPQYSAMVESTMEQIRLGKIKAFAATSDHHAQVSGDVAWDSFVRTWRTSDSAGKSREVTGLTTVILRRAGGQWRVVHLITSNVPNPR